MSNSTSPPNFSMILQHVKWIEADGKPTTYFFRLLSNIFNAVGAGQPPSVTEVVTNTFSQSNRSGADHDRAIADLMTLLMSIPDTQGRIATLERQVANLQMQLAVRNPPDINPLIARVDALTALTMGAH